MVDNARHLSDQRRLREPLVDDDVVGNVRVLIHVVADIHQRLHWHGADHLDHPLQQLCVSRTQRAIAHIEQWLVIVRLEIRNLVGHLFPYAAFEILELLGWQLVLALELHGGRIEQDVHVRARLEELAQRILLLAHRFQEGVEIVMDRLNRSVEMLAVAREALSVLLAAPRQMRRNLRVLDLVFGTRDDPHPRLAVGFGIALDRRKQDDIVDADDIWLHLVQHGGQILLGPFRRLDDHAPAVLHVIVDLVIGRFAEIGDMAVDEIDPELRHLLGRQRFREIDRMRLEAIALVDIEKARVGKEHHLVAKFLQRLADAHRIQRRTKGGLGKQRNDLLALGCATGFFDDLLRGLFRRSLHHVAHSPCALNRIPHVPGKRPRFKRCAVRTNMKLTSMTIDAMALISGVTPKRIIA